MPGDIIAAAGTKVYIGPQVTQTTDTIGEFDALSWQEVGLVENGGEFGDESSAVTGAALGDARMRKAKGARDAGTVALVCFHDPNDVGQAALEAAEQTNKNYAFKFDIPDAAGVGYSNSIYYFRGLVMSRRKNVGTNDNIIRNTYNIGINSQIYAKPSVFTT